MLQIISPENRHSALGILQMLRPYKAEGLDKVRVGSLFDGGYVMLDDFDGLAAAYSFGINDDVSWDLDMARRGIPIYQYDHTIDGLPDSHPLFNWRKVGISHQRDEIAGMETIESLIHANGHGDTNDLLLKCDIEGAEWAVLRHTPAATLKKFRQIVLEIHSMHFIGEWPHCENVRSTLFNLLANHRVVHVHGNNYGGWTVVGGIPLPQTMEFTLARKDRAVFRPSDEIFPTELDMPCNSAAADFFLGRFEFR